MKIKSTWSPYKFQPPTLPQKANPVILAFSCYFHDSSACILQNGEIIAAVDEERFTRKKHDASFPKNAINFCLEQIPDGSVDYVVFYENPDIKWKRIEECLRALLRK